MEDTREKKAKRRYTVENHGKRKERGKDRY